MTRYATFDAAWPQVVRVIWEREEAHDPDASPTDYLFQDEDNREEDQARLNAWRNDEWSFIGIRARATLFVPIGGGSFTTMELCSAGLWGIESDSGEEYLASVFEDEKGALVDQLATLGNAAILHQLIAAALRGGRGDD